MVRKTLTLAGTGLVLWVGCGGATIDDAFQSAGGASATTDASAASSGDAGGTGNDAGGGKNDGGPSGSYDTSCSAPGQCELGAPGCCGVGCGAPTIASYVGIRRGQQAALRQATCSETNPACPDCASTENPNLQAFCKSGQCTVVDIRKEELSSCKNDEDCTLRPAQCCPCGTVDVGQLVAIRKDKDAAYRAEVCDPAASCTSCRWEYNGARPKCSSNHCVVDAN